MIYNVTSHYYLSQNKLSSPRKRGPILMDPRLREDDKGRRNGCSCVLPEYIAGIKMRKERLELSRVAPLEPKSSASTSSATFAKRAT